MDNVNKYKGFINPRKQDQYRGWVVRYKGYDYSDTLIKKSISKYLYTNPKLAAFLDHLNRIMVHMVDSVKYIRNYYNFAVPKDYKHIN